MTYYDPDPKRRKGRRGRVPPQLRAWVYGRRRIRRRLDPEPRRFRRLRGLRRRIIPRGFIGTLHKWGWALGALIGAGIPLRANWKAIEEKFKDLAQKKLHLHHEAYLKKLTGLDIGDIGKATTPDSSISLPFWLGIALIILRHLPIRLIPQKALLGKIGAGMVVGSALASVPIAMTTNFPPAPIPKPPVVRPPVVRLPIVPPIDARKPIPITQPRRPGR